MTETGAEQERVKRRLKPEKHRLLGKKKVQMRSFALSG